MYGSAQLATSLEDEHLSVVERRREFVFMVLSGIFIGAMALLNVVGITKFVHLGPLALAVGVLPYPLTFLCTDLIGELYGRRRATNVVWVGLLINLFVIGVLWLGMAVPSVSEEFQPPWQVLTLSVPLFLPDGSMSEGSVELFSLIYACTAASVLASMVAYLAAQFCDVYLFHFWKRVTKGKHLWLRNNGSTFVSQLIDSVTIAAFAYGAAFYRGEITLRNVLILVMSNYGFKVLAALVDTVPFYVGVRYLSKYLHLQSMEEHGRSCEPSG